MINAENLEHTNLFRGKNNLTVEWIQHLCKADIGSNNNRFLPDFGLDINLIEHQVSNTLPQLPKCTQELQVVYYFDAS